MSAVSNSSPLILLSAVGWLKLLHDLFVRILIPAAVRDEVVKIGAGRVGAIEVQATPWIEVRTVSDAILLGLLRAELDPGEAEAIAIALEIGSGTDIVLDDRAGRRVARRYGLRVFGTAGVLVEAKARGLIPQVQPVLDQVIAAGLYLSSTAYQQVLSAASESG